MRHPSRASRVGHHEALLKQFFGEQAAGRPPAVQRRYERIHQHLLSFLAAADLSAALTLHEQAAVAAERRRGGSFFDALGFEELIVCLPLFVAPTWRLGTIKDSRAQVSLTGTLIEWLDDNSHLHPDMIRCAMYEAQSAIRRADQQFRTKTPPPATIRRAHLTLLPGGRIDT